jgi:hypothetical protein
MRNALFQVVWEDKRGRRFHSPYVVDLANASSRARQLLLRRATLELLHVEIFRLDDGQKPGTRIWHYDDSRWQGVLALAG